MPRVSNQGHSPISFSHARHVHLQDFNAALDAAAMPTDVVWREAVREHVEFGSRVAMQNSHATSDAELHPLREVPRWTWLGGAPPGAGLGQLREGWLLSGND